MWDLPGPGIEPMSLLLAAGFLTTGPPGKSNTVVFYATLGNLDKQITFLDCSVQHSVSH